MRNKTLPNRRDFLKKGLAGFTGAAFIPSFLSKKASDDSFGQTSKKTETRTLGKTGIKLPILSIGGGTCWDKAIFDAALEAGIKHLDTSNIYQNGNHERLVGEVMKGRNRDSVVIATSGYFRPGRADQNIDEKINRAKQIDLVDTLDASLQRLGLDYVDIYYMAGIDSREVALLEQHLTALQKLKKEGKARFIGITSHSNEHIVLRAAAEGNVHEVAMVQYNHLQPHKDEVKRAIAYAHQAGLGIVAMKTQAGGKVPNHTAALKWVLQDKNVCTAVPTMKSLAELKADLPVLENLAFTSEEKAALENKGVASAVHVFCANCGKCLPQCPKSVDVASLMRSYMYAYGHKNLWLARENMRSVDLSRIPCSDCRSCSVKCAMGFDVRQKIAELAWVKNVPDSFLA
ncbi:MAG: aldo/keto reductase [Candidatus Aminicenantes bacterium]|nr:aldo/keto reductase [Candidatus Aminicenantes bacterium]